MIAEFGGGGEDYYSIVLLSKHASVVSREPFGDFM